jgi:hypothetical protein
MSINKTSIAALLLTSFLFTQCSSSKNATLSNQPIQANITKEGFFDCFEKGLSSNGMPVWCEASAIVHDGKKLILANDKDMPGKNASVFYWAYEQNFIDTTQKPIYSTNALLKKASKYEDFAQTPDGKYILLSTGFDRVKPASCDWDNYNTILYWAAGDESHPKVLTMSGHESDSTSVSLRPLINAALASDSFPKGPPYYKIEGLAATSKDLYFGIREEGTNYEKFRYQIKVLSISYTMENGIIKLGNVVKIASDINGDAIKTGPETIALSSIEYDHFNNRFLILTSYEKDGNIGGYLWAATENDLRNNRMYPVKDVYGKPVHFHNKSEDLAIINKTRIIVIHDDDRQTLSVNGVVRQPYQAAYSIVDFK